jgi:hypothetical protein
MFKRVMCALLLALALAVLAVRPAERIQQLASQEQKKECTVCVTRTEAGGTLEELQAILGHSKMALTERYGKLRPHAVAEAAARIDRNWNREQGRNPYHNRTATLREPSRARNSLKDW